MMDKNLISKFTDCNDVIDAVIKAIAAGEEQVFTIGSLEIPVASLVRSHTHQRTPDPKGNFWSYTKVELSNGTILLCAGGYSIVPHWFDDKRWFPESETSWQSGVPARIWKRDLIKLVNEATDRTYLLIDCGSL